MKPFLYLILSIFLLESSVSASSVSTSPVGGMSGGGGDTINYNHVMGVLYDAAISARAELIMLFKKQRAKNRGPMVQKLLSSQISIFDIIQKYQVRMNFGGCYDSDGTVKDASIVSDIPNTICLNESSLILKLAEGSVRTELLSLLAHEFSHLAGFSEDDATALQIEVQYLVKEDSRDRVKQYISELPSLVGYIQSSINGYNDSFETKSWNKSCYHAMTLRDYFSEIVRLNQLNQFSVFSDIEYDYFFAFYLKVQLLVMSTCGKSDYHPSRFEYALRYKNIFGINSDLFANYVSTKVGATDVEAEILIAKINTFSDEEKELSDILNYINAIDPMIDQIRSLYSKYFVYK